MTEGYRLVEEVWIAASPERVFRAWTDPEDLVAWWGVPGAYQTTTVELELRVGGRYRFGGTSETLGAFEVTGEYREIDPPNRLAYTWNPGWDDGAHGSVVALTFEAKDGGTRLVIEHTAFATESSRDDHKGGWPTVAAMLKAHCEG